MMADNPVAVWQCPNCQRIQTLTFYGGVSAYTANKWCTCYGKVPSNGRCIELRSIYRIQPLNDLARSVDESEAQRAVAAEDARLRAREALAAWPPAPCDRYHWEARF